MRTEAFRGMGLAGLVVGALGLAGVAVGQEQPRDLASGEVVVHVPALERMVVSPLGVQRDPVPGFNSRTLCNQLSSKTTSSFTGGTYTAQAGFVTGEALGVTYDVPADAWPIRIDLAECVFVTSGATQQVTAEWRVEFWSGVPNAGTVAAFAESNDIDLPHIRIGPGTAGVNVQFSVDPGDPDQFIINNNGSNRFTVVWKILRQTSDGSFTPCLQSPPTARTVFPVTDNTQSGNYTQLNFPSDNWLFGLNCGILGCPPNGGWSRFSNLSLNLCRPRGDWVTRVTWSSLACTPGQGACCLQNGTCVQADDVSCGNQGGVFQGAGVSCAGVNCPVPTGACCFSNGFCTSLTSENCTGAGGTWQGANTTCGAGNTCPTGACCLPSGNCVTATNASCTQQNGTWRGANTSCATANCPQPEGACCFANNFCLPFTQATCAGALGNWAGPGTTCPGGCGSTCDSVDFNNDGVFPDDADVSDFLLVLGGGACATCNDVDFNNDGVFPDDGDVATFLLVLGGGNC